MESNITDDTKQFCTFYLEDLFFGIEVSQVQEVLRYQEMTAVPLAPSVVKGLINLRGQIVPAIDLRRRLNFAPHATNKLPMNVVVNMNSEAISLLVDHIGDVFNVDNQIFEEPPETLSGPAREVIVGAYKLPDKLMLVLDVKKLLGVLDGRTDVAYH